MSEDIIVEFSGRDGLSDPLNDLLKRGAEALLAAAIEAEVDTLLAELKDRQTPEERAGVVQRAIEGAIGSSPMASGHHPERDIQTGIGPVKIKIPKVRAKTGVPVSFHSAFVPPYMRKTQTLEAAIPWLYLKGISTGEIEPALKALLGPKATGFSAKTVARLKAQWAAEYETWCKADLSRDEWVYIWAPSHAICRANALPGNGRDIQRPQRRRS